MEPRQRRCRSCQCSLKPPRIYLVCISRGLFFILSSLPSFAHAFCALNVNFRLTIRSSVISYLGVVPASSLLAFSVPFLYVSLLDIHYMNIRGLWGTHFSCWNGSSCSPKHRRGLAPTRSHLTIFSFVWLGLSSKLLAAPYE